MDNGDEFPPGEDVPFSDGQRVISLDEAWLDQGKCMVLRVSTTRSEASDMPDRRCLVVVIVCAWEGDGLVLFVLEQLRTTDVYLCARGSQGSSEQWRSLWKEPSVQVASARRLF